MSNTQIIIDGIKAGQAKTAILLTLVRNDSELDLVSASTLYGTVGKDNNLLLSSEDKTALVLSVVMDNMVDNTIQREAAVNALVERGMMTKSAAFGRIKKYAGENDLEISAAVRSTRDMEAVKAYVKDLNEKGHDDKVICDALVQHFGYTEKNVATAYRKIGKELGFIAGAAGRTELAQWFITPENVVGSKDEIVTRLMESTNIKKSTAEIRFANFLFAVEYAKLAA